jgi:hypothetical protein
MGAESGARIGRRLRLTLPPRHQLSLVLEGALYRLVIPVANTPNAGCRNIA